MCSDKLIKIPLTVPLISYCYSQDTTDTILYKILPEKRMDIAAAKESKQIPIFLSKAAGRISGEYIYIYPPGIPIVHLPVLSSQYICKHNSIHRHNPVFFLQSTILHGKHQFPVIISGYTLFLKIYWYHQPMKVL